MLTKQEKVWSVVAAIHLAIVGAGALGVSFWEWGKSGAAISYYGLLSGASGGYGFFAPDVGTGLRAEFDAYDEHGKRIATEPLAESTNRETTLRLYDLVETLTNDIDDVSNRKLLATSWAGKVFARHPDSRKLVLRIETIDVPTMEDYRQGDREDWEPLYRAEFRRKGKSHG